MLKLTHMSFIMAIKSIFNKVKQNFLHKWKSQQRNKFSEEQPLKQLKTSIIDMPKEEIKCNFIKCSIKMRGSRKWMKNKTKQQKQGQ